MTKMDLKTKSLSSRILQKIAELLPQCVTESHDESSRLALKIDFEKLQQELGDSLVTGDVERYQMSWPGKKQAVLAANAPVASTLRPLREDSIDFDATRNLFMVGDNLEALKLLQETYLGKVKMIYIDPPYNTGSDFIYDDCFAEGVESYLKRSLQLDEDNRKLVINRESNGRFHSEWLSMMYPRLKLARNLLKDDGVIFVSIDDHEVHNLRHMLDEIFGSANFYCSFVWQRRSGAMDSVDNVSTDHEYVLCYGKQKGMLHGIGRTFERYTNPDNDPRGPWIADNLSAGKAGGDVNYAITDPATGAEYLPPPGRYWPYNRTTMKHKIEEGRIIFPKTKDGRPLLKRFKNEAKSAVVPVSTWMRQESDKKVSNALVSAMNTRGTKEVQDILGGKYFSHPKSTILIKSLASQCLTDDGDIVMDFFAGSATTGHAVLELNAEQGKHYRFVLIQIPETCDEQSEAYRAGFKSIDEIGKERLLRAGRKLKDEAGLTSSQLDVGYRTLIVDTSNMRDVFYAPDALGKDDLFSHVDNIKDDRTSEDLLFQVLLDWGVDLSLPIQMEDIEGKAVYYVDQNVLAACFDTCITEELVKKIASRKPLRVVFRDSGFGNDSVKINVEQIFKLMSPGTEVKSI
jgi:adenine-specific DNA-methyltransferase